MEFPTCANGSKRLTAVLSALPLTAAVAEDAELGAEVPLTAATGSPDLALLGSAAAVFCANGLLCRKREL